jgi:hypothetical protein
MIVQLSFHRGERRPLALPISKAEEISDMIREGGSISCPRCGGMMVIEQLQEIRDDRGESSDGLKCVLCGELLDRVILENRSKETPPARPRRPRQART